MKYKKVLAAIDFSDSITDEVVSAAVHEVKCSDGELFLMHVVEKEIPLMMVEGLIVPAPDLGTIDKIFERLESKAYSKLNGIAARLEQEYGVKVHSIVEVGEPFDSIIEKAEELDVDLIVVGAHSKSGIERLLMGSVSEKVARKAKRSVLIVRKKKAE